MCPFVGFDRIADQLPPVFSVNNLFMHAQVQRRFLRLMLITQQLKISPLEHRSPFEPFFFGPHSFGRVVPGRADFGHFKKFGCLRFWACATALSSTSNKAMCEYFMIVLLASGKALGVGVTISRNALASGSSKPWASAQQLIGFETRSSTTCRMAIYQTSNSPAPLNTHCATVLLTIAR